MKFRWMESQWARAVELADAGLTCDAIGRKLGLTVVQVYGKFENERHNGRYDGIMPPRSGRIARRNPLTKEQYHAWRAQNSVREQEALEDRERREAARLQQSYTSTFFGDPPPGYSALDKKKTRSEASA